MKVTYNVHNYKDAMSEQAASNDSATDLKKIIDRCKAIESVLVNKFGATGQGLHTKVDSVLNFMPPSIVKRLRFIASVRNSTLHEDGYLPPIEGYLRACDAVDAELEAAPPPQRRATAAPVTSNRLPRIVTYPLVLGILAILYALTFGKHSAPIAASFVDVPIWSTKSPSASKAKFNWRAEQENYDKLEIRKANALPSETYWELSGNPNFKEVILKTPLQSKYRNFERDAEKGIIKYAREMRFSLVLGGLSGQKATLITVMYPDSHSNIGWGIEYGSAILKFENGDSISVPNFLFTSNNLKNSELPNSIFSCDRFSKDGCISLKQKKELTGLAISRVNIDNALKIK